MHAVGYFCEISHTVQIVAMLLIIKTELWVLDQNIFFGKVRSSPNPGPTPDFTILGQDLFFDFD